MNLVFGVQVDQSVQKGKNNSTMNAKGEVMRYAVVEFSSSDSEPPIFNELPECWIFKKENKDFCWWPKNTVKVLKFIKKPHLEKPNNENWACVNVKVHEYCDTWEKARKKTENPDYVTTDDQKYGRSKRKIKKPKKYDSDDDEEQTDKEKEETKDVKTDAEDVEPDIEETGSDDSCDQQRYVKNKKPGEAVHDDKSSDDSEDSLSQDKCKSIWNHKINTTEAVVEDVIRDKYNTDEADINGLMKSWFNYAKTRYTRHVKRNENRRLSV